jgi:hypothetical protein
MTGTTHQHRARPPPPTGTTRVFTTAMDTIVLHGRARESSHVDPGVTHLLTPGPSS